MFIKILFFAKNKEKKKCHASISEAVYQCFSISETTDFFTYFVAVQFTCSQCCVVTVLMEHSGK